MTPTEILTAYRQMVGEVGEDVVVRRYSGTGSNRPKTDVTIKARVMDFDRSELVGTIVEGSRKIIALAEDIEAGGISLPIRTEDFVVVRGKQMAITAVDDSTRRVGGTLIALEITAKG
jgi:hypothetical protein